MNNHNRALAEAEGGLHFPEQTAAAILKSVEGQPLVTIRVRDGTQRPFETFMIQKSLVCRRSAYFRALFAGYFEEAKTLEVELDDVNPETFRYLKDWWYTTRIQKANGDLKVPNVELCKFWILADRFNMPTLQNLIMRELSNKSIPIIPAEHEPTTAEELQAQEITVLTECCHFLWEEPDDHSKLKKFFLDFAIRILKNYNCDHVYGRPKAEALIRRFFGDGFERTLVRVLVGGKKRPTGTGLVEEKLLPSEVRERYFVPDE